MKKMTLRIEGMSCQNCVRHVREALMGLSGVTSVRVNLDKAEAVIAAGHDEGIEEKMLQALTAAGYPGRFLEKANSSPGNPGEGWRFNVMLGSLVTLPLMIAEWGFQAMSSPWFSWISFALVLPVQIFCGARFYKGAWLQLKSGHSNMDTLVALGSSTAFLFSTYGLFFPDVVHHTYFMEAAAIITLISVGHWLEAIAAGRAARAIHQLLNLAPVTAWRLIGDEIEEEVAVLDLKTGDAIIIRPGDSVPVDGIVVEGKAALDESMLTGESIPVEKSPGDPIYAGTVNTNGRLICRVEQTGEGTALARIASIVEHAQNSRAEIQRLVDRISSVFVPAVILIAVTTFLIWGLGMHSWEAGIINAVAVLIVACPCAMGLATPAAIMAGAHAGAKRGILIRDGIALEKTRGITTVVFDKTGTLTTGKLSLDSNPLLFTTSTQVSALVKALSSPSLHPVSQALALHAKDADKIAVTDWREISGRGVSAQEGSRTLRLGSLSWLEECNVSLAGVSGKTHSTLIGLASDRELLAVFSLSDQLRAESLEVIRELKYRNLDIYVVSGDRREVVRELGRKLDIPESHLMAGVRPEGKISKIVTLQGEGRRVAFVGDGINDAPALTQSDLGIAVSRASDVAKESADIVLLRANLVAVIEALDLSKKTLRTIKQNLFWAFIYNIAAIPLAVCGLASPVICAASMGLSDLFLIGNSMRLVAWRPSRGAMLRK
jgi:Cu+-exporting ATPase